MEHPPRKQACRSRAALFAAFFIAAAGGRALACVGDCNGDRLVSISELITCVNTDLGTAELAACPACSSNGRSVVISDLIAGINNALSDICRGNSRALYPAPKFAVGVDTSSVAMADMNGDGHADVVAANSSSNDVSVLLG